MESQETERYSESRLQSKYKEYVVDTVTWHTFLGAAEFLRRLGQKLNKDSATFVKAGHFDVKFSKPYGGIPTERTLNRDVPARIKEGGPEYFELSCSLGEVSYNDRKSSETLRIFCGWPENESDRTFEALLDDIWKRSRLRTAPLEEG